jgi:NADPH-dependent 2,4-dienoyl-CoA reductase/sulfur reductase-like enzyme
VSAQRHSIKEPVVVIGGDAAGMSAAAKIRREQSERPIVVFERSPHTSYSACGIPYYVGGQVEHARDLIARSPETFRQKYHIDARVHHEVMHIDHKQQRVKVRNLEDGDEFWEPYGKLLVATGAVPKRPDVPGSDASGIFGVSTLASGLAVRRHLVQERPHTAVVVGGGYIGLEMAEALVRRGLHVALVERASEVMGTLDRDMGALVSAALRDTGVTLYLEETATGFETTEGRVSAVVTDRRTISADLVVLGLGVRPNTHLADEVDIARGESGALRVSDRLQTSVEGIWAAGDCAESWHLVSRRRVQVALGTVANKHGLVAGTNIAGGDAVFPGIVGTAVSKICQYEVARTGLGEEECRALGIDCAAATIESLTRAGYYPGAGAITVKLVGERGSGRLVGGQIVGIEGAAKRIDVVATALTAGMTVEALINLDLSYAPPFSPVWDPVQIAARRLAKAL